MASNVFQNSYYCVPITNQAYVVKYNVWSTYTLVNTIISCAYFFMIWPLREHHENSPPSPSAWTGDLHRLASYCLQNIALMYYEFFVELIKLFTPTKQLVDALGEGEDFIMFAQRRGKCCNPRPRKVLLQFPSNWNRSPNPEAKNHNGFSRLSRELEIIFSSEPPLKNAKLLLGADISFMIG